LEDTLGRTWNQAACQGVGPTQIRKGATQAVVGGLMGGSGPKSIRGSSRMNSGLGEYGKDTGILDWFRPPENKTLRLVWWDYVESDLPSNGALGRLIRPAG
jgi:hypothetical protein